MKREEAIAILDLSKLTAVSGRKYDEAIDMAIEALSAETENRETAKWLKEYFPSDEPQNCWSCKHYEPKHDVCHAPELVKQVTSKPDGDIISRADAINAVCDDCTLERKDKCKTDGYCYEVINLMALPSAEAEPTVIRSKTLMPTKDFKEWAKRVRETNPNAVVIPCDAEVVSAEAVQGWIPCSERLPDIKEHHVSEACLVYCENGAYGFAELEENIFGQVGWSCEREDEYHEPLGEVIAWMPLPKPYKGGDNE